MRRRVVLSAQRCANAASGCRDSRQSWCVTMSASNTSYPLNAVCVGRLYVKPYHYHFETHTKGRWVGRTLLQVFHQEFPYQPQEYFVRQRPVLRSLSPLKVVRCSAKGHICWASHCSEQGRHSSPSRHAAAPGRCNHPRGTPARTIRDYAGSTYSPRERRRHRRGVQIQSTDSCIRTVSPQHGCGSACCMPRSAWPLSCVAPTAPCPQPSTALAEY